MLYFSRGFTLDEALHILLDENENLLNENLYIQPPEPNILTDEDSADEDAGGLVDNLSGNQLRAFVDIELVSEGQVSALEENIYYNAESQQLDRDINFIFPEVQKPNFFKKGDLEYNNVFPSQTFEQFSQLSPMQLFELFYTNDIIDFIIYESTLYSLSKNYNIRNITRNELRCFLAILILSGYNVLPGRKFYWDGNDDMTNYMVKNAM